MIVNSRGGDDTGVSVHVSGAVRGRVKFSVYWRSAIGRLLHTG